MTQASAEQQAQLKSLAFDVQVMDKNFAAAPGYFLVHTRQAADLERIIAQPPPGVALIATFDARQALARSTPIAAEQLLDYGAQLQALIPSAPIVSQDSSALPSVVVPHPAVQDMLDDVTAGSLTALVADLSGEQAAQIGGSPYIITTRYSRTTTPIEKATQYAYEHLAALGLDVAYHSYDLPGTGIRRNVIGEQAGLTQPERIFVLSAHIDSTSGSPNTLAPGADDNASGTAGVLAAAEILSQYSFGCTLRYALFSGEEQGLYGSQAYANAIAASGDNVEAVLNLDMVAFNSDAQPIIDLYTRPGNTSDLAIANLMADVASAYNLNLIPDIIQNGESRSDHASFWSVGYPAILAIEDFSDFTPDYHTINDTLDTLDMAYFTEFVRAALGSMAHMGCGLGTLSGQVQILDTGAAISGATIRATATSGQKFVATSQPDGQFEMFLPAGVYDVAITAAGYSPFLVEDLAITNFVTTNLTAGLENCLPPESLNILYSPALPQAGEPLVFTATTTGGY
ncbi:MAG TPA: M28 family peptidase, partial [Anaerolineales bacterium]|nr:M28 family peptidase [Anaerolineales bacterium]